VQLGAAGQADWSKRRQKDGDGQGHHDAAGADDGRPDQRHAHQLAPGHANGPQRRILHRLQMDLSAQGLADQQQGGDGGQRRERQ
jgi:hypothetical protein